MSKTKDNQQSGSGVSSPWLVELVGGPQCGALVDSEKVANITYRFGVAEYQRETEETAVYLRG